MGKIYYNSPTLGPLTRDEYWDYLQKVPHSSSTPVVTWHGWEYNAHGVCLNPNTQEFCENPYSVEMRTAQNKEGKWVLGYSIHLNGGGSSCGANCNTKAFETENEAKYALLCEVEQQILNRIEWEKNLPSCEDDDDGFDYGQEKLAKNREKKLLKLLSKVRYYQEIYNNQTLF